MAPATYYCMDDRRGPGSSLQGRGWTIPDLDLDFKNIIHQLLIDKKTVSVLRLDVLNIYRL